MTLILQGTDNSVSSPAVQGGTAGTTTGVYYPASNQVALATNAQQRILIDSSGTIVCGDSTTYAFTASVGSLVLSNGSTDTPNLQFLTGANKNWGIDSWNSSSGASNQYVRILRDVNELTGKVILYLSESGVISLGPVSTGASPVNSGTGIAFPATQNASSDANTLDDYEEGTWTPILGGSSGQSGQSYGASSFGRYVKVGGMVTLTWQVVLTNKGTVSGTYSTLQGFPFTVLAGSGSSSAAISYYANWNTGYYWMGCYADPSSTFAYITGNASAVPNISYIGPAQIANTTVFIGSITYPVA